MRRLIFSGKEKEFFSNTGLTENETKVYLSLVKIGSSKIGDVAKETGIQRPNLYKIIDSLGAKGLIEKEINAPIRYRATSPLEAINMLVEQKRTQFRELEKNGKIIAQNLENQTKIHSLKERSPENKFIIIPGKALVINKLRAALENAHKSLDVITSEERFSSAIMTFAGDYENKLKQGLKIRIITEDHQPKEDAYRVIEKLAKNASFKVRFLPPHSTVDTIIAILDGKEVFTTISAMANSFDTSALWTNNQSSLLITKSYFESKWQTAQPKKLSRVPQIKTAKATSSSLMKK
jgi:sugar-specific transcriptional regulator TrmB